MTQARGSEVAAAATLGGAAAVGGKVAWDKLSGPGDEAERAYRLHTGEPTPEGLWRIARGQLVQSLKDDVVVIDAVVDELNDARTCTATWTFDRDGFTALEPGFRRIYRRGRKA
jgi:hypothetical protein